MTTIPPVVPPLPTERRYVRDLTPGDVFVWLRDGWRDLVTHPGPSLLYGLFVFLLSAGIVAGLVGLAWDFALFPAIAGFLVFAPALAIGLYDKSRALELGEPVSLRHMLLPHARAGGQVLFTGALLCGIMLLWMRAAVIIYALFFGIRPFPGLDHITLMLFTTTSGIAMLVVGSLVGGLFAAFSFAISAFSIPMMLDKRVDALTAMGTSWALVWNNLATMLVWGLLVLLLFILSVATGFAGLIIVFPWLGHATWHAYRAVR
ncbi:DUF2189 domain-containing protein (plasmid) [Sphingobium sp. SJ10-10]|uniref:Cytochrome c oxidase, subunit I n=1 Tax=Sphingomonas sp. NS2 TaxID=908605 RepID=A0A0D4ZYI1_9SPHN|nr:MULTISPECIES: DUF2189 domain-containing protein [unclassified Sphingobium]AJW29224.1 hypothetical protein plasmid201_036 [Sphingomonas sp. NS2]AMK26463.1 hypothetical protein K426_27820 [Sphingobium sp. TKS]MEC6701236.1 DUF2189 domain-containing protein [Sphingobium sp. SJ10-10]NML91296.1 DUF2189 domain-containing protein [Sphingobium sp. TB-6]